jgi:hypothetical protein
VVAGFVPASHVIALSAIPPGIAAAMAYMWPLSGSEPRPGAREGQAQSLAERALGRHQTTSLGWQTAVEKFIEARRSATRPETVAEYEL